MIILLLFYIAQMSSHLSSTIQHPVVYSKSGIIYGKTLHFNYRSINAFYGIPYAEPPVGSLRFKRTVPVKAWSKPIMATSMKPACIQYAIGPFPWKDDLPGQSENCLNLNIWVPLHFQTFGKKAVMFWIHGGSYFLGSNRMQMYDATALASVGDIIIVTINYRLGVLGFLYSGLHDAPGNVAIYDMLQALKWINENIEFFGGDKHRITIAGASAGALAVGSLMISPLSKNLFHQVIMQSVSPAIYLGDRNAFNEKSSQAVSAKVGCGNETNTLKNNPKGVMECLRGKKAIELVIAQSEVSADNQIFFEHYGDELLPKDPFQAVIENDFKNTNLLIGNTADEGSCFMTTSHPMVFGFFGENPKRVNRSFAESYIKQIYSGTAKVENIIDYYLRSISDNDSHGLRKNSYASIGDRNLVCPDVYFAEKSADQGNNVYFYYFYHRPKNCIWASWMGKVHYEDIKFTFGMPLMFPGNYTKEELQLSDDMIEMWSNFVKYGSPLKNWPLYSRSNPAFLILDTVRFGDIGYGPKKRTCDFLRPYLGFEK